MKRETIIEGLKTDSRDIVLRSKALLSVIRKMAIRKLVNDVEISGLK